MFRWEKVDRDVIPLFTDGSCRGVNEFIVTRRFPDWAAAEDKNLGDLNNKRFWRKQQ